MLKKTCDTAFYRPDSNPPVDLKLVHTVQDPSFSQCGMTKKAEQCASLDTRGAVGANNMTPPPPRALPTCYKYAVCCLPGQSTLAVLCSLQNNFYSLIFLKPLIEIYVYPMDYIHRSVCHLMFKRVTFITSTFFKTRGALLLYFIVVSM